MLAQSIKAYLIMLFRPIARLTLLGGTQRSNLPVVVIREFKVARRQRQDGEQQSNSFTKYNINPAHS